MKKKANVLLGKANDVKISDSQKKQYKKKRYFVRTLAADIKNGQFKNAYLICGEEEYLKLNYKNQMIKAIVGEDKMNLGIYEGKNIDINEVIDSAETFPFFAEHRLIVMDSTGLFKSGGEETG